MLFCNITISHSSIPCDILGKMFKLKVNYYTHIITLPTTLKRALLLLDPVFSWEGCEISIITCSELQDGSTWDMEAG